MVRLAASLHDGIGLFDDAEAAGGVDFARLCGILCFPFEVVLGLCMQMMVPRQKLMSRKQPRLSTAASQPRHPLFETDNIDNAQSLRLSIVTATAPKEVKTVHRLGILSGTQGKRCFSVEWLRIYNAVLTTLP